MTTRGSLVPITAVLTAISGSLWGCGGNIVVAQEPAETGAPDASERDGTEASAVDAVATEFPDFTTVANWETFYPSSVSANAGAFSGAAFDGRYLYLVPSYDGIVTQYDTQAAFTAVGSWAAFDVTALPNVLSTEAFAGAAFDGRYVYVVPGGNDIAASSGRVVRYDTQGTFSASSSWSTFDTTTVNPSAAGFDGATFDGRYLYLIPYANNAGNVDAGTPDGVVARYDTEANFTTLSAWSTFDVGAVNPNAGGFSGGAFDGRFTYLVPNGLGGTPFDFSTTPTQSGLLARYDTQATFVSASSWSSFDTTTVNANASGFSGATFDGRYLYFTSFYDAVVARYDTEASFESTASWSTFTPASASAALMNPAFDGHYVYVSAWDMGLLARYDTQESFTSASSWTTFDATALNASATSFTGSLFDGQYVYFVPGETGVIARFDARSPALRPKLPALQGSFF